MFAFFFNVYQAKVRVISQPRPVTVLFYCLDPIYPGLAHVAALDVEGFLANSESTRQYLLHSAPTALVPLAVDTDLFSFYPDPPCPDAAAAAEGRSNDGFNTHDHDASVSKGSAYGFGRVVYVGAAGLLEYKGMLAWMLREAAPYGLDIYGSGWQNLPEFSEYWRGVLPQNDLVSDIDVGIPVQRCHGPVFSLATVCYFRSFGLFARRTRRDITDNHEYHHIPRCSFVLPTSEQTKFPMKTA